MVLHKADYDSNDCELPCGQATPQPLSEVWLIVGLHVGWVVNGISIDRAARWLVRVTHNGSLCWRQLLLVGCWQVNRWALCAKV